MSTRWFTKRKAKVKSIVTPSKNTTSSSLKMDDDDFVLPSDPAPSQRLKDLFIPHPYDSNVSPLTSVTDLYLIESMLTERNAYAKGEATNETETKERIDGEVPNQPISNFQRRGGRTRLVFVARILVRRAGNSISMWITSTTYSWT